MKNKYSFISGLIVLTASITMLCPILLYRENYIFTIHDYLDSWPPLFEVLRRSGLFFALDSEMPIMGGISTCYLYFDFGAYRLLNFLFGPIWGEILNKVIGMAIGFYSARKLFSVIAEYHSKQSLSAEWIITLLAGAYALSAVYPNWTISFAFLPLYLEMLYTITRENDKVRIQKVFLSLLFGFFVYFPCIGMFVFELYFVVFIIDVIKNRRINRSFFLYGILMFISIVVTNINIFIYVLRGDELNRSLIPTNFPTNFHVALSIFIKTMKDVGQFGQYHAAPVLQLLIPICVIGYIFLFLQLLRKRDLKRIILPTEMILIMAVLCMIYTLDEMRILRHFISKVIPFLKGFNLGRVVYFNNILWYILATAICLRMDRNRVIDFTLFFALALNVGIVVMSTGDYRDVSKNIFHDESLANGNVTFAQFYDTEYFDALKKDIGYDGEGVISVGYHPAVAIFNGFNTLDGYMSTNPLDYHYHFRKIIEPTLNQYPSIAEYYDTWGGRLYCYVDESKDVEPKVAATNETKELLINSAALYDMGGRYILSKYKLDNADDLGISLVEHKVDIQSSIYQVWVYEMRKEGE